MERVQRGLEAGGKGSEGRRTGRGDRSWWGVSALWLFEDARRQGGSRSKEEKGSRGRTFSERTVIPPKGEESRGQRWAFHQQRLWHLDWVGSGVAWMLAKMRRDPRTRVLILCVSPQKEGVGRLLSCAPMVDPGYTEMRGPLCGMSSV